MNGYLKSIGTQNSNELHEDPEVYLKEMNADLDSLMTYDQMTD